MIEAWDTETSGLDLRHGARPFFVTTCDAQGRQTFYEWDVDPYTREVNVPPGDVTELNDRLRELDEVVGHNIKFDATALAAVGVGPWPWDRTHDTTLLAHLLASNQPKDLTALAVLWLGRDISGLEVRLGEAVKKARSLCKRKDFLERFGEWDITSDKKEDPRLPSGGGWHTEYWLPKVMWGTGYFADEGLTDGWDVVCRDYANEDSAVTACLFDVMLRKVQERGLEKLYEERRKLLGVTALMEVRGLTISRAAKLEMTDTLARERDEYAAKCHTVARKYDYDLVFPKGASPNDNLRTFCFDVLGLPPVYGSKTKTANPTLNKDDAIPHYLATLPEGSDGLEFIRSMVGKRARDTGLAFSSSWDHYLVPIAGVDFDQYAAIHATFNPAATDTLRFSSKHPNTQQIGKKDKDVNGVPIVVLRKAFGPAPGREWWSLDFANIELRIPAYISGEQDLIGLFERANEPPFYGSEHLLNFSVVYPDIWEDAVRKVGIDKAGPWVKEEYKGSWYGDVKNGDFAVAYQAGDATADKAFRRPGSRALLKQRFAKKEQVVARTLRYAEQHGYIETLPDRTVDPNHGYPLWTQRTDYGKVKPTLPFSYLVQGTAGWIANRAAVRVSELLADWNGPSAADGRPGEWGVVAYVHDELVFDFPKRAHPKVDPKRSNLGRVRALKRLMEQGGDDLIPAVKVVAAVEYHPVSWGDGIPIKC